MIILEDDTTLDSGTGTPEASPNSPTTTVGQDGEPQSPVTLKFPNTQELDPVPHYPAPPPYQHPISPTTPPLSPQSHLEQEEASLLTRSLRHNASHMTQLQQHNNQQFQPHTTSPNFQNHSHSPHSPRFPLPPLQTQLHENQQAPAHQGLSPNRLESQPLTQPQRQEFQRRTTRRFYSAFLIAWLIMVTWSVVLGGIEINSRRKGRDALGKSNNGIDESITVNGNETLSTNNSIWDKFNDFNFSDWFPWPFPDPFLLPFNLNSGSREQTDECDPSIITVTFTPTSAPMTTNISSAYYFNTH